VELSGGVQNIFDSYQDDFETGALRDSDYIYGPNRPRTFFIGLKFGDF
jgi:outer membrane receptor for ferrienterochelin and colicins